MAGSFIPDFLVEATTNFRATQYTVATGCALWGYDILLILDQELKLLWSKRANVLIKTIYILNGDLPIIGFGVILSDYTPIRNYARTAKVCALSLHLTVVDWLCLRSVQYISS